MKTYAAIRLQQMREKRMTLSKSDLAHAAQVQPRWWLRRILQRRQQEAEAKRQAERHAALIFAAGEQVRLAIAETAARMGVELPQEVRH